MSDDRVMAEERVSYKWLASSSPYINLKKIFKIFLNPGKVAFFWEMVLKFWFNLTKNTLPRF